MFTLQTRRLRSLAYLCMISRSHLQVLREDGVDPFRYMRAFVDFLTAQAKMYIERAPAHWELSENYDALLPSASINSRLCDLNCNGGMCGEWRFRIRSQK